MSDSTQGSRIRQAREYAGLSVAELAARVKRTGNTVYRYEWGQFTCSVAMLQNIADSCGVEFNWLATGSGPMKRRGAA